MIDKPLRQEDYLAMAEENRQLKEEVQRYRSHAAEEDGIDEQYRESLLEIRDLILEGLNNALTHDDFCSKTVERYTNSLLKIQSALASK